MADDSAGAGAVLKEAASLHFAHRNVVIFEGSSRGADVVRRS